LTIHRLNDIRHPETHTAKKLIPEPSSFKTEISNENPKRYKSPSIDHTHIGMA